MAELKNARGYTTAYEYDKVGNLTKTINALGGESTLVYDRDGNLISETNTDGATTTYAYDRVGRVISITDAKGAVTTAEYDGNGNVVKVTQPDGHSITYTYDAADRLASYVDAAGHTHSLTYDGNGNIISETDGNGNTTHYTYDKLDRLIGKTDAEGGISSKTYDADGRLIKAVNEEGAETNYQYDDCGRIVKMTDALGNATTYTYDEMDRVLTVTDPRGGVTKYTYTDRGDIQTQTNAESYTISYEYDENRNMVKKTTADGDTVYAYDVLDRLSSVTTPDGKTESFEYNGEGQIVGSTDKGGHKTSYILDEKGNIIETIDALGNSTMFEYDSMDNLTKTSMHRVDTQDNVDEWEITLYEFDGRGLVTKEVNALGNITTYAYDGNGNLKTKIDAEGRVTTYTYNGLDMLTHINYNGGKEVSYQYNKVGDLTEMNDWTGRTTFEVDLLNRITKTTDTKGKAVEYTYDETGNQTSVKYPDNTTASKTYDLIGSIKTVTETDGRTTRYTYDGMNRVSKMEYSHGWVEDYEYDGIGQLLKVIDIDPSNKELKQQKHAYQYDDCGNMVYEYMRGNGTGEATVENTYIYDALHRVVSIKENYGNKTRTYQYDSLSNLTYETELGNKSIDYKLNNLNQATKKSDDGWKTQSDYTYDRRGDLIQETYTMNSKVSVTGAYTYDETNKMVLGVNDLGESSAYLYNGLGALVENTWVIKKNAYGYHDVSALTTMVEGEIVVDNLTGTKDKKGKLDPETVAASPTLNKTSTVVKQFVVDYTSETFEPLMENEVNGLDYRYVYGNDRLSVDVKGIESGADNIIENGDHIRLYYHMDYLGTTDYLTNPVSKKVTSWTHYNEWGEISHNAVLKCGQRELDLVKRYATHDYDSVLDMYYAKARFYDAGDRRFTAIDPILDGSKYDLTDYVKDPVQFVQYLYVENNPVNYVDLLGLQKLLPLSLLEKEEYGAKVTYRVIERRIGNHVDYYDQAVVTMNGHTRTFNAYPKTREFMRMGLCNNNKMLGSTMLVPSNYVSGFLMDYYFDSALYRGTVSAMLGFVPGVDTFKDIQEAISGYDIVAGRELTEFEKGAATVAIVLPIINKETVKFVVNTGEVTVNLLIDFAKVAKNSDLESDLLRALKRADNSAYEQFVKNTGRGIADDVVKGGIDAFGNLSKAADYGLDSYSALQKTLKGTGLEAHHIVEKRLADALDISNSNSMLSVAVTKAEHQAFTNEWRRLIPYGTDYSTLSNNQIWEAAQKVYKNYPELLEAAKTTIFK